MKILIVGIDGLEYNVVELLNLKNLKQKTYNKLDIPEECFVETDIGRAPYTPKVWTALLTGEPPIHEETRAIIKYRNPIIEKIRWIPILRKVKGKRFLLRKIGINPKKITFRINRETFLDKCTPSIYVNIPGVNLWEENIINMFELAGTGKLNALWLVLNKHTNKIFKEFEKKAVKSDYKVAMMYINSLDIVSHLCWFKCFDRVIKLYKKIDRKVGQLLKKLDYDISLIISDHGMEGSPDGVSGKHSHHLFYSINIDHRFKDIYEIPNKIIEWCNK